MPSGEYAKIIQIILMMKHSKILQLALCGLLLSLLSLNPFSSTSAKPIVNDQSGPIHVIGTMSVMLNPTDRVKFDHLTQILFNRTTEIDRPTVYTCNEDINAPGSFVWNEIWASKAELDKHLASDHFKSWWSWVEPHLSARLQVLYVNESEFKQV